MEGTYFLKIIIGLPDENIKYIDNKPYVDNVKIEEEFTKGTIEIIRLIVEIKAFLIRGGMQ